MDMRLRQVLTQGLELVSNQKSVPDLEGDQNLLLHSNCPTSIRKARNEDREVDLRSFFFLVVLTSPSQIFVLCDADVARCRLLASLATIAPTDRMRIFMQCHHELLGNMWIICPARVSIGK